MAGKKTVGEKVGDAAESAIDAVKDTLGGAADKAGDVAGAGVDAAKGALGAVGGMLGGIAGKAQDVAGDAVDAAKGAAVKVGDAVEGAVDKAVDVIDGVVDDVKEAVAPAKTRAKPKAAATVAAGAAIAAATSAAAAAATQASGAGASGSAPTGGSVVPVGGAVVGARSGGGGEPPASGGSGDGSLPPLSARLKEAEERRPGPGLLWPAIGVASLGLLAYVGWYTIGNGQGTIFTPKTPPPVVAAPAPAPAAPSLPGWLAAIGERLKGQFGWLGLGARGDTVIASGEAPDAAAKANALGALETDIKAAAEGAKAILVDNITVKGSTDAPVGAAVATLGDAPDVAACAKAFTDTMAGRTINFSTGGAEINADSGRLLDALTGVATACRAHRIEVAGHTDTVGDPAKNLALSQARADAVKAYWTGKGVPAEGLAATGYGETRPMEDLGDQQASEKNRRIEFAVTAAP
jgi:OOP family OmpA-OmpF porin